MPVRNALVPAQLSNRECETPHPAGRAHADFVAHLIATSAQAPQTRARRRAEPAAAIAAYCEVDRRSIASGRLLSRSL